MHCFVYRSEQKAETYLYLAERDCFTALPTDLLKAFGTPHFLLELDLSPERKLARENVLNVLNALRSQGYFLQLPPPDPLTIGSNED